MENNYLLFNDGRGDINIKNDGQHSDLFWMLNSKYPSNKILNNAFSTSDKIKLEKIGVNINNHVIANHNLKIPKYKVSKSAPNSKEKYQLSQKFDNYNFLFSFWRSMITTYNIKIYFTWHFFTPSSPFKDSLTSISGT